MVETLVGGECPVQNAHQERRAWAHDKAKIGVQGRLDLKQTALRLVCASECRARNPNSTAAGDEALYPGSMTVTG